MYGGAMSRPHRSKEMNQSQFEERKHPFLKFTSIREQQNYCRSKINNETTLCNVVSSLKVMKVVRTFIDLNLSTAASAIVALMQ